MNPIPEALVKYINAQKPMYGFTDLEFGGYFHLEPLENLDRLNHDIQIGQYAPAFTAFASDGGGEVFVFDDKGVIYLMPLIGMEPSAAIRIADSWGDFESHIEVTQQNP